jgi:hypothetical protein
MEFPPVFTELSNALSLLSFDFVNLAPVGCLGSSDYTVVLMGFTMIPLMIFAFLVFLFVYYTKRGNTEKANSYFSNFLLGTFLVLPAASTKILTYYACKTFDDDYGTYMVADYSISCDSSKYKLFSVYASVFLVIFVIGIPSFYFQQLWTNRHLLDPGQDDYMKHQLELNIKCTPEDALAWALAEREKNELENPSLGRLKFLYEAYEPSCFLFEVAECVRRLLLTGGLVLFAQGSGSQIVCSMLICILSIALYSHYTPFIEKSDDDVVLVAQCQLFFTLFAGLIIRAGFDEEDDYNEIFFDGMLVFIQFCGPAVTVWFLFKEHRDDKKEKLEAAALKKKQMEEVQSLEVGTSLSHSHSLF